MIEFNGMVRRLVSTVVAMIKTRRIIHADCNNRHRHRQKLVPYGRFEWARRDRASTAVRPQAADAGPREAPAVPGGDGGVLRGSSSRAAAGHTWPHRAAHPAAIRQAVCEIAEE